MILASSICNLGCMHNTSQLRPAPQYGGLEYWMSPGQQYLTSINSGGFDFLASYPKESDKLIATPHLGVRKRKERNKSPTDAN